MTDEIRTAVAAERRALADLYASLTPQQWETPSLCAGWRVHEVLAHATLPYRFGLPRFALDMVRARGNFNRMSDRRARADAAALSPAQLVDQLYTNVEHPWAPPGGGPLAALSHDVIHGLDVTVPLGRPDVTSLERVLMVLVGLSVKQARFFGVDLERVRLTATDADWTFGDGDPVAGRAADILLLVCGRAVPPGALTGAGAAWFNG